MTKQRETLERNAAEKKNTSLSLSLDGASRQKEVRSFHLAVNGSDKIFDRLLTFVPFVPDTRSGEVRASCDEDQPAQRGA